jgi:hypothetical protein
MVNIQKMVSMSINWNIMKVNLRMDLNMDTANLPKAIKDILVILLIIYIKVMGSL